MLRSGDEIGPYTLINKLGSGAFGVVWLAERRTQITTTTAAVKIPLDEDINLESIKHEADLWVRASGHPNVLPIIEANVYGEHIIIASEYAPDGSLESYLKKYGKAPSVESAVEIVSGILAGLEHLHSRNIIHRDLKPANILFQSDTPRLADFGISRVLKSTSQSITVAGTPSYMAPEAFDGKRNEQTDIWSVGVIFYQLLTGRLPFAAEDITSLVGAILSRNPEPLPPTVPVGLQNVIARALAKDKSVRYKSAAEMRADLRNPRATDPNFQIEKSVYTVQTPKNTYPPEPISLQTEKKSNAPHFIYAIAGLLSVIIVVLGLVFLFQTYMNKDSLSANNTINNSSQSNMTVKTNETQISSQSGNKSLNNPKTQPTSSPLPKPVKGEFKVNANSRQGTKFVNPFNQSAIILFRASGQWTFCLQCGFHSAAGSPVYTTGEPQFPLPNSPAGSLVVHRDDGTYEYVGSNRTIELAPDEQIIFLINDAVGRESGVGFEDNKGIITLKWECQNCN